MKADAGIPGGMLQDVSGSVREIQVFTRPQQVAGESSGLVRAVDFQRVNGVWWALWVGVPHAHGFKRVVFMAAPHEITWQRSGEAAQAGPVRLSVTAQCNVAGRRQ